jgi:titin
MTVVNGLKDGAAVPLDDRHVTTLVEGEATLSVSELVTEDGGSYSIVATNTHGEASSSSTVTVEEVRHRRKKEEEAHVYMKKSSHSYDTSIADHNVGAEFTLPLVDLSRAAGDEVTFTVTVTCRPEPQVTWYHDLKEVNPSARVSFQHDKGVYRLTVQGLMKEDAGEWKCHAYNDYGDAWCSCNLNVIQNIPPGSVGPMFIKDLEYTTASEGSLVRLECKVTGEPKPNIKWFKDRKCINNDGHYKIRSLESTGASTLVIEGVKVTDTGSYMCLAENDAGSEYSEARMKVSKMNESRFSEEPMSMSGHSSRNQSRAGSEYRRTRSEVAPDFTSTLKSKRAPEGTTVRLNCSVTGIPEPLVRWFKDGQEIFDNKTYTMRNNYGLLSLEIVYAKADLSGKYTVEAENPAGTVQCSCVLEIEGEEEEDSDLDTFRPKFSAQIEDVTVSEGDDAVFMCTATGKPMPIFKWQKDMIPLAGSRKLEMEYDNQGHASLTVFKCTKEDAGLYYCIAYSRSGRNKCTARLNVKAKSEAASPRQTPARDYSRASSILSESRRELGSPAMFALNLPTELDVVEGESLKLDCSVLGLPTPLVTWHKAERELCYSQRHRIVLCGSLHTMEIPSCMMLDRGTYIVRATNAHGSVESSCYVHVLPRGSKVSYKPDYRREAMREAAKGCVSSTPFFIKHLPKTIDVMTGTDVRLDCILRKGIELIRWSHSPSPPKEAVQASKQLADEGFEGGFISTQQEEKPELASYEYLSFSETPQDLVQPVGSEAVFECSTSGTLDLEVKWYKDGRQLIPSDAVTMMSSGNRYRLKLKAILKSDQGEYTCKATSKKGTKSCAATLTIAEDSPASRPSTAPQPVEKGDQQQSKVDSKKAGPKEEKASFNQPLPKTTDAVSGNDVAFTCKVRGQVKEVTWEVNNKQLPKEARYFVSYDKSSDVHCLTVSKVTEKDSAKYTCVAKLAGGDLIHTSTKLQVSSAAAAEPEEEKEFKPKFISGLKDSSVQDGEGLTLVCEVEGNPRPQISWFRDGVEVFDSQDVQISMIGKKCTLQIIDVFPEDEGDYSCTAVNSKGEVTTECYVSVEGKGKKLRGEESLKDKEDKDAAPEFVVKPRRQFVNGGETAKFKVSFDGPQVTILSWIKDGVNVKETDRYKMYENEGYYYLEISQVTAEDAGNFTCVIKNSSGSDNASAELEVYEKPKLLSKMAPPDPTWEKSLESCTWNVGQKGIELVCTAKDLEKPEAKWYHNDKEISGHPSMRVHHVGQTTALMIKEAKLEDAGNFKCVMSGQNGQLVSQCKVTVLPPGKMAPPVFVKELHDMEVEDGDKLELVVEVKEKQKLLQLQKELQMQAQEKQSQ